LLLDDLISRRDLKPAVLEPAIGEDDSTYPERLSGFEIQMLDELSIAGA
jgi:hypothetical protein